MKRAVLLVAHGSPAKDLPREILKQLRAAKRKEDKTLADRKEAQRLEDQVRNWPRNAHNDPYRAGTEQLAAELRILLGEEVRVLAAYNEFAAPDIETALQRLAESGATHIDVLSTMMTPGGGHSERDIPLALGRGRQRWPAINIVYRWPFDLKQVAALLKQHI